MTKSNLRAWGWHRLFPLAMSRHYPSRCEHSYLGLGHMFGDLRGVLPISHAMSNSGDRFYSTRRDCCLSKKFPCCPGRKLIIHTLFCLLVCHRCSTRHHNLFWFFFPWYSSESSGHTEEEHCNYHWRLNFSLPLYVCFQTIFQSWCEAYLKCRKAENGWWFGHCHLNWALLRELLNRSAARLDTQRPIKVYKTPANFSRFFNQVHVFFLCSVLWAQTSASSNVEHHLRVGISSKSTTRSGSLYQCHLKSWGWIAIYGH